MVFDAFAAAPGGQMDLATFRGLLGDLGLGMTDHEVNNLFTQLGEDLALATGARSLVSVDDSAAARGVVVRGLRRGADGDARVNVDMFMAGIRRHHFLRRIVSHYTFTEPTTWAVPRGYDYNRSTTENYAAPLDAGFVGELVDIRARLDADYHGNYGHARQLWQDAAAHAVGLPAGLDLNARCAPKIDRSSPKSASSSPKHGECAAPNQHPWLVFTYGAMGACKGWVMNWMSTLDILPLRSIVHIDPDRFKQMMPEWAGHVRRDAASAGTRCHKESGLLAELAQELAMRHRLHVWVDGSLRDHGWYEREFDELRAKHPTYKIALFYAHAGGDGPGQDARVGERHVDFVARIDNDGDAPILEAFESVDTTGSWKVVAHMFGGTYGIPAPSVPPSPRAAGRTPPGSPGSPRTSPLHRVACPEPPPSPDLRRKTEDAERRGTPKVKGSVAMDVYANGSRTSTALVLDGSREEKPPQNYVASVAEAERVKGRVAELQTAVAARDAKIADLEAEVAGLRRREAEAMKDAPAGRCAQQ
ncbi:zeta toxin [Aureococcus anophagefferens]|nr:zeta toxin [Aureococcus anophagefferens]